MGELSEFERGYLVAVSNLSGGLKHTDLAAYLIEELSISWKRVKKSKTLSIYDLDNLKEVRKYSPTCFKE